MARSLDYMVEPKENIYFGIALVVSLLLYTLIILGIVAAIEYDQSVYVATFGFYALIILILLHLARGVLVGMIRGNAIKLGPHQFGDIHAVVMSQAQALGLTRIPDVYLLQQGGSLNAFATRFMGSDYIVLFSDIMEEAYEQNQETVEFVIAHELGHVKRNHIIKRLIILPAMLVPFLGNAYSRACEYTCDSIGASLSPDGARVGLLLLAAGTKLFRKVDTHYFIEQAHTEAGFWFWFSEKVSTHPHLAKRLGRFAKATATMERPAPKKTGWEQPASTEVKKETSKEEAVSDVSKYMPK